MKKKPRTVPCPKCGTPLSPAALMVKLHKRDTASLNGAKGGRPRNSATKRQGAGK